MKTIITKSELEKIRNRMLSCKMEDTIVPIYVNPLMDVAVWMLPNYLFTISIGNIELLDVYDIEFKENYAYILDANDCKICKVEYKER